MKRIYCYIVFMFLSILAIGMIVMSHIYFRSDKSLIIGDQIRESTMNILWAKQEDTSLTDSFSMGEIRISNTLYELFDVAGKDDLIAFRVSGILPHKVNVDVSLLDKDLNLDMFSDLLNAYNEAYDNAMATKELLMQQGYSYNDLLILPEYESAQHLVYDSYAAIDTYLMSYRYEEKNELSGIILDLERKIRYQLQQQRELPNHLSEAAWEKLNFDVEVIAREQINDVYTEYEHYVSVSEDAFTLLQYANALSIRNRLCELGFIPMYEFNEPVSIKEMAEFADKYLIFTGTVEQFAQTASLKLKNDEAYWFLSTTEYSPTVE